MTSLSARDRVDALAALGLVLYLDDAGQLRARGSQLLVDAARPTIRQYKAAIVEHLLERHAASVLSRSISAFAAANAGAA